MCKLKDSDSGSDVDPIKKSIKYGTTFQAFKGIIFEYFIESSIHGFKYISDRKRSAFERIIWMGALIFSIVICCLLIADIWKIRTENPVIVTFDEKPTPISEIPFPTITICPETKAHSKIFNYSSTRRKILWKMNITDAERQCYYQNEMYLRYFEVYTQANCEVECLANQTLALCGCVHFSMPRNSSQPVCGGLTNTCQREVSELGSQYKFDLPYFQNITERERFACSECLPTCFSLQYEAALKHSVPFHALDIFPLERLSAEDLASMPGFTEIIVEFKDDVFIGLRRSEVYSTSDFIARTGGLLGLFMGVSILSLVELVYFFTVRLWMNLQTRKSKQLESNKVKDNELQVVVVAADEMVKGET